MKMVRLMAISNEEVLNIWGRKLLTDRGYTVSNDAFVSVDLSTGGSGCCDECYGESAVIQIISKGIWTTLSDYQFEKILLELVEISRNV
jgi:hypothetical protein